jgi:hypothetical protein
VEPDQSVLGALETNKKTHNAKFHIFAGVVSLADEVFTGTGYGAMTERTKESSTPSPAVKRTTVLELQKTYGLVFDTLVADCEGALLNFLEDFSEQIQHFRLIIFEQDQTHRCDYNAVKTLLKSWGFKCVEPGFQEAWVRY